MISNAFPAHDFIWMILDDGAFVILFYYDTLQTKVTNSIHSICEL
jgi:hypothetical protein